MTDDPADRMRERSQRSTLALYVLLDAERRLVALSIVVIVFLGLVATSFLFPGAVGALRDGDPVETAYQALVGATVTGVTIVLTLNQLVLSQELGAVGDQRERMEGSMQFRDDVEDMLGEIPPAEPSAFLGAMVEATDERAERVRETVEDLPDDLSDLIDSTQGNADSVQGRLEESTFGEFEVVRAALDFNYSWKLYEARRILDQDDSLPEEGREALEAFVEALQLFGPAREHFKTLYFQSELISLSRTVLYASIPSLIVTVSVLIYLDLSEFAGTLLYVDRGVLVVSAATAIAIVPFAVLLAYVLRIATITGRTLSIGPFILRETERDTDR